MVGIPMFGSALCCERVIAHDVTKYHAPKPRQAEPSLVHIWCSSISSVDKCSSQICVLFRVQQHTTVCLDWHRGWLFLHLAGGDCHIRGSY